MTLAGLFAELKKGRKNGIIEEVTCGMGYVNEKKLGIFAYLFS